MAVIIDLKRGGLGYRRTSLRDGTAVQLALYRSNSGRSLKRVGASFGKASATTITGGDCGKGGRRYQEIMIDSAR
jgi:hypothetical protein